MIRIARIFGALLFWYVGILTLGRLFATVVFALGLPKTATGVILAAGYIAFMYLCVRLAFFNNYNWVEKSLFSYTTGSLIIPAVIVGGAALYVAAGAAFLALGAPLVGIFGGITMMSLGVFALAVFAIACLGFLIWKLIAHPSH